MIRNHFILAVGFVLLTGGTILVLRLDAGDAVASKPFEEEPISIPGRVEAENFDLGGAGVAYHDVDSINLGNGRGNLEIESPEAKFRREEAVDLSFTREPNEKFKGDLDLNGKPVPPGSIYVGWTKPGEWLRFTVNVERAGTYRFSGKISSRTEQGSFELHFSENDSSVPVTLPKTGSAHTWTLAEDLGEIELVAGKQTLTLRMGETTNFNLDWLRFDRVPDTVASNAKIDFNREIRPILADNCYDCHGPDEHSRKADLRLDIASAAHEYAITPGNAEDSLLVELMLTHDEIDVMPPPESPRQPTQEQIEKLIQWIDEGAEYDEHWSFVEPVQREIPDVSDPERVRNEIDAFVLSVLDAKGKTPRRDAPPGILARRLSLVLTGLPVLPERLLEFEAAYEKNPDKAIEDWVDELLASTSFGEHLAWTWLDAARYADTNGYQGDGNRIMWPWRDWLIETLNDNMPYDEMTRRMLAGDLLIDTEWDTADWIQDEKENELLLATGFLRNHRYDSGSGTIPEESKFENAVDRMETVGTVWMGMTMQCARCHTHKYDPIQQQEYFEMLSFFDNVPEFGSALRGASHPFIRTPLPDQRAQLDLLTSRIEETKKDLEEIVAVSTAKQTEWERSLIDGKTEEPRLVKRSLQHRYVPDGFLLDGKETLTKPNDPMTFVVGGKEWTISFWFRPDSEEDGAIFSSVEEPDRYRHGIQADWVDQKIRIRRVARWVNSYIEFESVEPLEVGQWYHVTLRSDGRIQGVGYEASINGDDEAMHCTHYVTNDSAGRPGKADLVLGGSPFLPGSKGELKDLRFYDRTLGGNEVAALAEPRPVAELAAVDPDKRSETEASILATVFAESDAFPEKAAELQKALFALEQQRKDILAEVPTTMVMKEADMGQTFVRPTGTYDTKSDYVSPGVPAFLPADPIESPDRLAFAEWLMQPDHPLTGRVAVNRLWQFLWGSGLVDAPENFGIQTPEPIHSELLDWLAVEYAYLGWDT
ncbi:MAG: DUF1549 domain-containing protein, partial [Verrucomicrobiota bacterium]